MLINIFLIIIIISSILVTIFNIDTFVTIRETNRILAGKDPHDGQSKLEKMWMPMHRLMNRLYNWWEYGRK